MRFHVLELGLRGEIESPVWERLQDEIRRCANRPRHAERLTRISRVDGGCDYQSPGTYDVVSTHDTMGDYAYTVNLSE